MKYKNVLSLVRVSSRSVNKAMSLLQCIRRRISFYIVDVLRALITAIYIHHFSENGNSANIPTH